MVWTAEPTKLEACNLQGTMPSYTAIRIGDNCCHRWSIT